MGVLHHAPDPFLGILYAEDFDGPSPAPSVPFPPEALEPSFSSAEMEVARQRAREAALHEARAEWERSDGHARMLALAAIAAELAAAQQSARHLAEAAADATVRAILTMAAQLLPARCAAHGPAEVRAVLGHLLPTLAREPRIAIRVNPALLDPVQADLALLEQDLAARIILSGAAELGPGDVRVAWTDGTLVRSHAAIAAALQDVLAELDLLDPNEGNAHADQPAQ